MGIKYNDEEKKFVFDFQHDGVGDIISLTSHGYQVQAFGKCFYYGYEFADDVDGNVRSAFIKYLKFPLSLKDEPNLTQFIQKAIDDLNSKINLYDYDLVVMPQSSSKVNQYMLRYIYRFAQPSLHYMELVKALPEHISFDIDGYERFQSEEDKELVSSIRKNNVLIVDDISTSGSTLNEILRSLRILNDDNNITIFSLLGRKDLMIEAV